MRPDADKITKPTILLNAEDLLIKIDFNDPRRGVWRLDLRIRPAVSFKEFAYQFGIHLVGDFTVHPDFPMEHTEQLVHVNAPTLLYSIARKALADSTARSPYPQIILPIIGITSDEKLSGGRLLTAPVESDEDRK